MTKPWSNLAKLLFKSEIDYRKKVCASLEALGFDTQSHEDSITNFIPDVSFGFAGRDGWIEFKYQNNAPKTLGSIHHWTKGQENWLIKRGQAGGRNCFLLLGTPGAHFVWSYEVLKAARHMPLKDAAKIALIQEPTVFALSNSLQILMLRGGR